MRARGAKATDIVVLVVAADDGVMPQTIEAIQHAQAAKVPVVIAVNKMDKPGANPDRVRQELLQHQIISEDLGGENIFVNVSAKTGQGIDDLLEALALQAEIMELKAPTDGVVKGIVIEASLDRGRGPVATLLVQRGTLHKGDVILTGREYGRVRAMLDERGKLLDSAGPSTPVVVLGLSGVPTAGDDMLTTSDERKAREIALFRQGKFRDTKLGSQPAKLEDLFARAQQEGQVKTLNLLVKADYQGSIEALKPALEQLSTNEVQVRVIGSGVGGITESDVNLAHTASASIMGFNVRADSTARSLVAERGVELLYYSVIYNLLDDVKLRMSGLLEPKYSEKILGLAEVREVFHSKKLGAIAGCRVIEGVLRRNNPIRVLRDHVVIFEGALESLRRFKDDVLEVRTDMDCGIGVKNYNDIKPGDRIEVFEQVREQRSVA
jgi:translation initiation factor IF-2